MTLNELGKILAEMYEKAAIGEKVVKVHLFGVMYAEEIKAIGSNKDVAVAAGIPETYGVEIGKGVLLAKYGRVNPTALPPMFFGLLCR